MLRTRLLGLLIPAAVIMAPSIAFAGCGQHRLVGSWQTYVMPSANSWLACNFKIASDGSFQSGSTCVGSVGGSSPVTGKVILSNCVVTGQFSSRSRTYTIKHASFNADRTQIAGVVRLANGRFVEFKSLRQ